MVLYSIGCVSMSAPKIESLFALGSNITMCFLKEMCEYLLTPWLAGHRHCVEGL